MTIYLRELQDKGALIMIELMKQVVLQATTKDMVPLKAIFLPEQGMNMASFTKGNLEIMDLSTKARFLERRGGLGPLIGPHFYHRPAAEIPHIPAVSLFPHVTRLQSEGKGLEEPFSHGIGRYVPWRWTASNHQIDAYISGSDKYKGVTLAALEGFDFEMHFVAKLHHKGLHIRFKVSSDDHVCVAGLHYYYKIHDWGFVSMDTGAEYGDKGVLKHIDPQWLRNGSSTLNFHLDQECDYTFYPTDGTVLYQTATHSIRIKDKSPRVDHHSVQLYHPKEASYVCIEPISTRNPRDAQEYKNNLNIEIEIL